MSIAMRHDRRRSVAVIALLGLAVVAASEAAWVDAATPADRFDEAIFAVTISVTAALGAVVALARPANRIGWLMLVVAVSAGLGEALTETGVHGLLVHPGSVPAAGWLVMFGVMFRSLAGTVGIAVIPAYFPDGRVAGPRWRWLPRVIVLAAVLSIVANLLAPIETRLGEHWRGPLTPIRDPSNSPLEGLNLLATVVGGAAALAALASLITRWRRGGPIVRQQLLLFVIASAVEVAILLFALVAVVATPHAPGRWVFDLGQLLIPVAVAVATLTYGLYDLRRATNRVLLWLLLSVLTAGLYVVVVVLATVFFSSADAAGWPAVAAATIAAIGLLALRDRVQRVVTRVVYGRWREPYAVLSSVGQQLSAASDLERLLADAAAQLSRELDLDDVSVSDARGHRLVGGDTEFDTESGTEFDTESDPESNPVPLLALGRPVGTLFYRCDRTLSEAERGLIRDLAGHLGTALHSRQLLTDLQRTRERLVLGREEERRRLRRDLHDGLGPALAALTLKAETARAALPCDPAAATPQLDELIDDIRATVTDVRRVVEGLRPPALDQLGLVAACTQMATRLTGGTGVAIRMKAAALPNLPAAMEVAAFRIVQEATTNTARHARATSLTICLAADPVEMTVRVTDDGIGVDRSRSVVPAGDGPGGNGMATMRERAEELGGTLEVLSSDDGTVVTACLPLVLKGIART
ncbi:MAG TPA: histidine kinase [Flexivirga sp.]|uniref:sensor histidine kinase n=1 Tax=Flexivirga sp. TaxID=1962927 RepID=UPI002BF36E0B|nr:histidine kinase [Flexivirga sp.]HWC24518.1 histidine kinase [Flexivirga sp.]